MHTEQKSCLIPSFAHVFRRKSCIFHTKCLILATLSQFWRGKLQDYTWTRHFCRTVSLCFGSNSCRHARRQMAWARCIFLIHSSSPDYWRWVPQHRHSQAHTKTHLEQSQKLSEDPVRYLSNTAQQQVTCMWQYGWCRGYLKHLTPVTRMSSAGPGASTSFPSGWLWCPS